MRVTVRWSWRDLRVGLVLMTAGQGKLFEVYGVALCPLPGVRVEIRTRRIVTADDFIEARKRYEAPDSVKEALRIAAEM